MGDLAMKFFIVSLACAALTSAQQVYELPFGSQANFIHLVVSNASTTPALGATVRVEQPPSWLEFASTGARFERIDPGAECTASFTVSVDRTAPVNREEPLRFVVSTEKGERWEKKIVIRVAPPERIELHQNFPNPFNPTTTIGYLLSTTAHVSLRVFDLLGREVAILVEEVQDAGYHQQIFSAARFASGVYVYQLTVHDNQRERHVFRKIMMLVR